MLAAAVLSLLPIGAGSGVTAPRAPHPNSLSESRIEIRRDRLRLTVVVQVLSLAEVLPELDPDLDGRAAPGALDLHSDAIATYVAAHYRLALEPEPGGALGFDDSYPTGPITAPRWDFLAPEGVGRVREAPPGEGALLDVSQYVIVDLDFVAPAAPRALGVEVDLFAATSPDHRDVGVLVWNGVELAVFDLGAHGRRVLEASPDVLARGRPALPRYVGGVARTAPGQWDLVLLGALLALAAARRTGALRVGLALTVAAAAGVFLAEPLVALLPAGRGARFLELAVPLSAAYVGADLLLAGAPRGRLLEALVFGLVAGARLAQRWAPELAREDPVAPARAGLALGAAGLALLAPLVVAGLRREGRGAGRVARAAALLALAAGLTAFLRQVL